MTTRKDSKHANTWADLPLDKNNVPVLPGKGCCSKVNHDFDKSRTGIADVYKTTQSSQEHKLRCVLLWECRVDVLKKLGDKNQLTDLQHCLLYTSPSPRDRTRSRMPSSA
eukprot:TRINITY_DN17404_c0_g1_i1.p1 TRINITY_DN17404_c0_g1~~TRINITY_DN17404_c0_g1_i1.p1  ORF type:complete len:110 (+),score=23.90 TRINITY_DN17404_c0_g1_i1:3-332(+)